MARYIDADKAIEKCNLLLDNYASCPDPSALVGVELVRKLILSDCETGVPTADVAEVKRGEWKKCVREEFYETRFVRGWYKPLICSECGYKRPPLDNKEYPICQNCGAKMDGGGNNT